MLMSLGRVHDARGDFETRAVALKGEHHGGAAREFHRACEAGGCPPTGELRRYSDYALAVCNYRNRSAHIDSNLRPSLAPFPRYRRSDRQNDDVVNRPNRIHDHGIVMQGIGNEPPFRHDQARHIEREQ